MEKINKAIKAIDKITRNLDLVVCGVTIVMVIYCICRIGM